ncbi:hypothetical protein K32_12580 [Kaistia sp. 32K]|uniref:hypothetical protein n=1 Tax=Kaistia sp. 32K TaxID=2795690 RepID=UPI001934CA53|nr:hypothetical protein [Kaistia sp. 32K]BCP52641.1 hypothetical protein K32_12580 [Kaistia sp. 32K]
MLGRWTVAGIAVAMTMVGTAHSRALVAGESKSVPTQSITIQPDPSDEDSVGATDDAEQAATPAPVTPDAPLPVIEYDVSKLPEPVRQLREKLLEAAKTGDIEKLKPIIDANRSPPNLGADANQDKDPVAFLKSQSGDPEGREILAILSEVLDAGYVHVDVGTPQEAYVWPYFARYPINALTPPQMVELFRLLTSSDYDEMKSFGAYLFYRVGIAPDGTWTYFEAGD